MTPLAALLLCWFVTALWPIVGASGMRYFSGLVFTEAGLAVGLLVLTPWLLRGGRWKTLLDRRLMPAFFWMGLFSGAATAIYVAALAYTTPANAAVTAQVEVIYSGILSMWLLGERPSAAQTIASALVIAGTGLIMAHDLSSPRWRGDLMILATPWMYQVSHIFSKKLPPGIDPVEISGARALYSLLALAPFCAWALFHGAAWSVAPAALGALLLQGGLQSSLNFVLWYAAIQRMDLAKATAVLLSYPALTMLFSWLLGRESVAALQVLGLSVTLAGAFWISSLTVARTAEV